MDRLMIDDIVSGLERAKAAVVVAPAKSGKSTYIPMKMYNEVLKRNPEGKVFIIENTERAASTLANFMTRIQKKKMGYLDESTELKKIDSKIIYMSSSRFVQILFDEFAKGSDNIASLVVISNAFLEDLFINLIQYLWYVLSFQGRRVPYLLFTSSIPGELAVIKDVPTFSLIPKDYEPTKVIYSTFDSTFDSIAKDLAEAIDNFQGEKFLVFVPTRFVASQVEMLIKTNAKLTFVSSEHETEVPHGNYSAVFDSCFSICGKRIKPSTKLQCEMHAQYAKTCKRLLKKETFEDLSAGKCETPPERLLRVALFLSDAQIDYKSFFIINKIPETQRKKIVQTIQDLDIINEEGTLNERGVFVSQLYLDGYLSSCLYELLKKRKDIITEITLFAAISVCGTNIFGKSSKKSDLESLANVVIKFMESNLSAREFARENDLREKCLVDIKERTNSILKILMKLDFSIEEQISTNVETLLDGLESIMKKVYKNIILKHEYGNRYTGYSTFIWNSEGSTPSESLIPILTEEFHTKNGLRRVVTLGHPVNDLDVGKTELEEVDKLFDDL